MSLGVVVAAVFLRPDLARSELSQYISPTSAFLTPADGAEVHYRVERNPAGPTIVLIHGGLGSLHNWEPWVPRLGAREGP